MNVSVEDNLSLMIWIWLPKRFAVSSKKTFLVQFFKKICIGARVPFSLRFVSDHFEFTDMMKEAGNPGVGARLAYELVNCGGLSG